MAIPQFGEAEAGRNYVDRPAAFGIAERHGLIALVKVSKPGHPPWRDLPGGALDPGEEAAQAVVREFGEEAGLRVEAGAEYAHADQLFINTDGKAYNNRAAFFALRILGEGSELKIEDDHELIWTTADEAVRTLRHDAHAWAVAAWLRRAVV